jgi:integrase
VRTRLAALSSAHLHFIARNSQLNLGPESNPLRDARMRQLISGARRVHARRGRKAKCTIAATRDVMDALIATCGDDLIGKRDRALLLFGWASGGRRRSEIVAATFENVRRHGNGFLYELGHRVDKRNAPSPPTSLKPIQGVAARALEIWIKELLGYRITHGPIFRRIHNNRVSDPLKDGSVREIIRRRAKLAPQPLGKLSAHSLRSGFVTEAGKQGISLTDTMTMTGHRSVQAVMSYFQEVDRTTSRAALLFEIDK